MKLNIRLYYTTQTDPAEVFRLHNKLVRKRLDHENFAYRDNGAACVDSLSNYFHEQLLAAGEPLAKPLDYTIMTYTDSVSGSEFIVVGTEKILNSLDTV